MCNNSMELGLVPHLGHGVAHIEDDDHRLLRRQRRHRGGGVGRFVAALRVRIFPGTFLSSPLSRPTGLAAMLRVRSAPHPPRCVRARSTMSAGAARVRYRYVAEQLIPSSFPLPRPLTLVAQSGAAGAGRGSRRRRSSGRAAAH